MAVSAGITDFTFMEEKSGRLFVNAPNAIDGNYKEKCDTSSAEFQARESGLLILQGTKPLSCPRYAAWYPYCHPIMKMICPMASARMI